MLLPEEPELESESELESELEPELERTAEGAGEGAEAGAGAIPAPPLATSVACPACAVTVTVT